MIAQDVLNRVRTLVTDPNATRWTNAALLIYLVDALDDLWRRRQTAFYTAGVITTIPTMPTAVGDTVYVQDSYRTALVHYICYLLYLEDSDDVANAKLSANHYTLYEKEIG